jgi:putative selenate reductase FAD-binding subunit
MVKNFIKPDTIEQALKLVKDTSKDSRRKLAYFGNGVFLNSPHYPAQYETVISLKNLGLNSIKKGTVHGKKGLKIGSMLTFQTIIDDPDPNIPEILKQVAKHEYSRPVRNMKTLGGDINVSTYSSHFSPVLVALSAMIELNGEDWMPFEAYKNTFQHELITNIFLPDLNIRCSVKRLSLNTHMPVIISVAASLEDDDDNKIIIAISGIKNGIETKTVYLSDLKEQTDKIAYIEKSVTEYLTPVHDHQLHGSREYMKYLTGVVAADCVKELL